MPDESTLKTAMTIVHEIAQRSFARNYGLTIADHAEAFKIVTIINSERASGP